MKRLAFALLAAAFCALASGDWSLAQPAPPATVPTAPCAAHLHVEAEGEVRLLYCGAPEKVIRLEAAGDELTRLGLKGGDYPPVVISAADMTPFRLTQRLMNTLQNHGFYGYAFVGHATQPFEMEMPPATLGGAVPWTANVVIRPDGRLDVSIRRSPLIQPRPAVPFGQPAPPEPPIKPQPRVRTVTVDWTHLSSALPSHGADQFASVSGDPDAPWVMVRGVYAQLATKGYTKLQSWDPDWESKPSP